MSKRKFVVLYGIFGWGLSASLLTIVTHILNSKLDLSVKGIAIELISVLPPYLLFGIAFGLTFWKIRKHREERK